MSGEARAELTERVACAFDVREPERAESFRGGCGAERTSTRESVEDRSEEELLVQSPPRRLLNAVPLIELLQRRSAASVAEPDDPRESSARVVVLRKRV